MIEFCFIAGLEVEMLVIINKLKWFFRQEFCKPCDFIYVDKKTVKQELKKNPLKVILAIIVLTLLGGLCMILYYLTLPFRLINELLQLWCEY